MNMITPIAGLDIRDSLYGQLDWLIAGRPQSPREACAEARRLVDLAIADTCQADNLWGAVDAFHDHFDLLMRTIDLKGADDAGVGDLRARCRFYLEQVEALA